jgi:hypothetical protein
MGAVSRRKKPRTAYELRGQLMLQIAAGKFFRNEVELNEREHRYTVYSNAWFAGDPPIILPVGSVVASTEMGPVSSAMLSVVDRLEQQRPDGTDDFMIATGGTDLVDDIAYVMTFILNRTVTRDHDQIRRLVTGDGTSRGRSAKTLLPMLFEPRQVVLAAEVDDLRGFMDDLLSLSRDDFARVMRAIRNSVDATRRALDDPTGGYTDLVAALESLADAELTSPATWERYDGSKRKILDKAMAGLTAEVTEKLRTAVLEADRAGLKRRFVSSTMARLSPDYYRHEARSVPSPPRAPEIEGLLEVAYDIRSRRSHVLEDLGEGVWLFTDGAETAYEARVGRVLTISGLWRLIRHVVRTYVASADKVESEPWDYRDALPGLVDVQLAPQYWIWRPGMVVETAFRRFNGFAEALIGWLGRHHDDGFALDDVCQEIEDVVPTMDAGEPAKVPLIAIHALWHSWLEPDERRPEAMAFLDEYRAELDVLSPISFTAALLSREPLPQWSVNEWAAMAASRSEVRHGKDVLRNAVPLPTAIDALIQLEAADQLELAGRHDEAVVFAANAVGEMPGNEAILEWESRLVSGNHDPHFDYRTLVFGDQPDQSDEAVGEADGVADSGTSPTPDPYPEPDPHSDPASHGDE